MKMLNGTTISRNQFILRIKHTSTHFFFFTLAILINVKAIISIASLDKPVLGFVDSYLLHEGFSYIFPLFEYLLTILINAILLYIIINRKVVLSIYELPTYALGVIAVETCLSMYGFNLGGVFGIRIILALLHTSFCGLLLFLYYRGITKKIQIKISHSDLLLISFSIGILLMVYIPFNLYNQFTDSAIVLNSAISITQRESLQPYYDTSGYYSPIGGFVSVVFAYSTSLNTILPLSSLPFLVASVLLPFIVYHFLKLYITEDERLVILGTIVTVFMDGLAVILLPAYWGNLNLGSIRTISLITKSMRFSSLQWLWITPYKILGTASAIATCVIFHRRSWTTLLLSAALFSLFCQSKTTHLFIASIHLSIWNKNNSTQRDCCSISNHVSLSWTKPCYNSFKNCRKSFLGFNEIRINN